MLNRDKLTFVNQIINEQRKRKEKIFVDHFGYKFQISPKVFSPFHAPSGQVGLLLASFPFLCKDRIVLDVGCGAGIFCCLATLAGAKKVIGVDINSNAIVDAMNNIKRIKKRDGAEIYFIHSNLFESLSSNETFDIIYADLPFISSKPLDDKINELDYAFYDPHFNTLKCFLNNVKYFMNKNSRVFITFSEIDNDFPSTTAFNAGLLKHSPLWTLRFGQLPWQKLVVHEFTLKP